jgi:hypothetical protein
VITGATGNGNAGAVYVTGDKSSFMMYGGNLVGNACSDHDGGGVTVVGASASFTMYGGTIQGNAPKYQGGGVCVKDSGTFIMYGGEITHNKAYNSGGGGVFLRNGTFYLYGGTISDNSASEEHAAGGVSLESNSEFYFSGGTISNNGNAIYVRSSCTAVVSGGTCDNAYVQKDGIFQVKGSPKITGTTGVYLCSGATITVDSALSSGASIGVTMADGTGTFTAAGNAAYASCFTAENDAYTVSTTDDGELQLVQAHKHPACGDSSCTSDGDPIDWKATATLPETSGSYYLTEDVTISTTWTPADGTKLCLNGHTIEYTGDSGSVINVTGAFTLTDCNTTTAHAGYVDSSGLWYLGEKKSASDTEETIYGGIITGGKGTTVATCM